MYLSVYACVRARARARVCMCVCVCVLCLAGTSGAAAASLARGHSSRAALVAAAAPRSGSDGTHAVLVGRLHAIADQAYGCVWGPLCVRDVCACMGCTCKLSQCSGKGVALPRRLHATVHPCV